MIFGLAAIALALGKTEKKTQKLIDAGALPVGEIGGEFCASLVLLTPYRSRQRETKSKRSDLASAAFIPQSSNSAALSFQ
jgi:hypothetical protein